VSGSIVGREDGGGVGHQLGRPLGMGSFACCFSLALLAGVAIFSLFQYSWHSNIVTILILVDL
jgi:hypothetical protein